MIDGLDALASEVASGAFRPTKPTRTCTARSSGGWSSWSAPSWAADCAPAALATTRCDLDQDVPADALRTMTPGSAMRSAHCTTRHVIILVLPCRAVPTCSALNRCCSHHLLAHAGRCCGTAIGSVILTPACGQPVPGRAPGRHRWDWTQGRGDRELVRGQCRKLD